MVGLVGAVQTPIPYAAVVAQWFDRQRGLALGIATAGVGLGVVVLPPFLALLINDFGWRNAYFGLGLAVLLLAWLPVALFVREPPALSRVAARHADRNLTDSLPGTEALAGFSAMGVLGADDCVLPWRHGDQWHAHPRHSAADRPRNFACSRRPSCSRSRAIAIIGGRILAGWCLDRFWGPYVAICFFAIPMLGIALLGSGATGIVPLIGAVLCGAGIGAEIDLMAFFLSRYFGLKAYGKIYGVMFAVFNIGTGLGPALSGLSFDRFHSYGPIFIVYEVALAITCVLFLRLGPYPYPAAKRDDVTNRGAEGGSVDLINPPHASG